MTITEFLTARLDEDEAIAREIDVDRWHMHPNGDQPRVDTDADAWSAITSDAPGVSRGATAEHIARHDPLHVLSDVAAKRAIVAEFEQIHQDYRTSHTPTLEGQRLGLLKAVAFLALASADHPDWNEEWRP